MFQMYFPTPRTDRTKGRVHKLSIDKLKTKADWKTFLGFAAELLSHFLALKALDS